MASVMTRAAGALALVLALYSRTAQTAEPPKRKLGGLARDFIGILATPHRKLWVTPGPWIALGVAGVVFAPHVVWQITHDWPTREFMRHATEDKMVATAPLAFLRGQVQDMHPLTALLWVPGLAALLFWKPLERWRPLGIAYVAVLALLLRRLLALDAPGSRDLGRLALVAGAALAFITVAIPLQLDKEWITLGWALEGAAPVSVTGGAAVTEVTTRSSRQCLVLDSGRDSMISTLSPMCETLFSSWTWQTVRRRIYLP